MSTFSSRSSTSTSALPALTSTKRSASPLLNRASRSTATLAVNAASSCESSPTLKRSRYRIERHRWLIQRKETGEFLASIKDNQPVWVKHPLDGLTHASMEIASHNLHKLRDFYHIDGIQLEPVMFHAYPERPTQWFTDYD